MNIPSPLAPIVYLTAELKSRDFDSRLLIAAHLVKMGFIVVVGQQWSLFFNSRKNAPKGCYVFKTLNVWQAEAMGIARAAGHIVIAMDEEALCSTGDLSLEGVHPDAMESLDLFLAQNDSHRNVVAKAYPRANISTAGSARADLMMMAQEYAARPLAERYILFNTNFPLTNGFVDIAIAAHVVKDIRADVEYELARREHLVALLRWVVDNVKDHRIVIRPHPGEKPEPWKEMFPGHPNVILVGRSDPVEWIAGAEVVIISDSTTGVEAALMNKPCLNISPAGFEHRSDERLPKQINFTVSHAGDAIDPLMDYLTKKTGPLAHNPKKLYFPKEGARRTAQAIAKQLEKRGARPRRAPMQIPWSPWEARTDQQREKFSVTRAEAHTHAAEIFRRVGVKSWQMTELDDSVFAFDGGA